MLSLFLFLASLPQNGDRPGEVQPPLPAEWRAPPAPALSPEAELATFRLPADSGLTVELVAAEPLVVDPVDVVFDAYGRLWVVEMRGYMPDIEGNGELEPVGRIAVLHDDDHDGRMDRRVDFLDELVQPRAVRPFRDGALVIAPPELLFCRDTDGDGRADERTVVDQGLNGLENPEHAVNGLLWTIDNWIHCANWSRRYRFDPDEGWRIQATGSGGQWGIAQDDGGRLYFNTNSEGLYTNPVSAHYLVRNAALGRAAGTNVRLVGGAETFPSRVNPGVNRAYQQGTLRPDGRLARLTGACGPLIHRGTALGPEYVGNAFVCEPTGNLVQRYRVDWLGDDRPRATHVVSEQLDFLTSTDERFRPVNLKDGPDGALYVVDFYRGLIQHRIYLTTTLRREIEARGLQAPIGLGRIWRVRPTDWQPPEPRDVADASWTEVLGWLDDENGFWRDAAQRILVHEGADDDELIGELRRLVREADAARARLHALWALEGLGRLRPNVVGAALRDQDEEVRLAALRCSEPFLEAEVADMVEAVTRASRGSARTRRQALLSLGEANTEEADTALLALLEENASGQLDRAALISGVGGRELAILEAIAARRSWQRLELGRERLVRELTTGLVRSGRSDDIQALLSLTRTKLADWQRNGLVEGILGARRPGPDSTVLPIRLPREPRALERLDERLQEAFTWPGRPGDEVRALTPAEELAFARGRELFRATCAACHQESGLGEAGKAPPLRDSAWALGDPRRLVRILDAGLVGRIDRAGGTWDLEMPAWESSDTDVAAILTYVRREWGHVADPVAPDDVQAWRSEERPRSRPWNAGELEGP